ncbi:MAG TPA: amino acid permease [Chthoniobacterales bacterium]|nr:amino acid permease [Chthoniobacterales bacterium]
MTAITTSEAHLVRRLGLFDTTMIVMGGIIGSGIFINPYVVAQQVPSKTLILGAWAFGGLIALAGAFIYAELSSQMSASGGQYVYLRDAFHPALAFVYGWALLLVTQTGGMAAVAVTFAKYACSLGHAQASDNFAAFLAALALTILTIINCLGVRAGSTTQNVFMILKLVAIAALVAFGLTVTGAPTSAIATPSAVASGGSTLSPPGVWNSLIAFGAALIPVQFAYGGWQTSCFVAGEVREPRKNLPRGLLLGVVGVIAVYLSVNFVCVQALGPQGLGQTTTPASAVMRLALGESGARIIAIGIAVSTVGFLSQSMLTAPRVYFAMAEDGLFFTSLAKLNRARVPAFAIALQGALAIVITLSGRYEQILNYVISVDVIFFALTAATVFVFRRRAKTNPSLLKASPARTPGHPFTTLFFIVACGGVAFSTLYRYPHNSLIGLGIMLTGLPAYLFWKTRGSASR